MTGARGFEPPPYPYDRLDVLRIVVPPLRERPEDVGPLARQFWREAMRRTGGQAELSPATLAALARYHWPGNVRELQNAIRHAHVMAKGEAILLSDLPNEVSGQSTSVPSASATPSEGTTSDGAAPAWPATPIAATSSGS